MEWQVLVLAIFSLILLFIFLGVPVAASLGLVGILSAHLFLGKLGVVQYAPWSVCENFVLTAVPLFVFMGELLLHGGISKRLYDGSSALVGWIPGGLLHANIFSCSLFAAVSGSSVATAATIGTIAIPELKKRNYETKLILGSLAGGGTLGILIPPSIPLIIYGMLAEQSVGALFVAGVLPGIMLASLFMTYIAIRVKIKPNLAPSPEGMPLRQKFSLATGLWPVLLLISIVFGGIYLGVFTPTEAAAVGACSTLILTLIFRRLTWAIVQKSLLNTVKTSTMVIFIIIAANIVQGTLGFLRVSTLMSIWLTTLEIPPLTLLIAIYLLYIFLGCFFEGVSMMILTAPIIFPVVTALGYDPIWFGIALVILIEMAALTPPVGMNLYTIHGISPEHSLGEVIRGSMPFFFIMNIALAIVTAFPSIALWLPSTMR